jgi:hypothetical protein
MEELGRIPAQGAIEEELSCGGNEKVFAAHDFADSHGMIVGDAGELVAGKIVVPPNDEIAEIMASGEVLRAKIDVLKANLLRVGNAKAPAHFCARRNLLDSFMTAGAGVNGFLFTLMGGLQGAQDILTRTGAGVRRAQFAQAIELSSIQFDSLALVVRGERPADVRAFVPGEAEPLKVLDECSSELGPDTGAVQIFVAEDERAASGACAFLRDPKSTCMAEVQIAGRRRGEASAILF